MNLSFSVTGGTEFPFGAFVSTHSPTLTFTCSGALVASNVVLTAAHCLFCATHGEVVFLGDPSRSYSSAALAFPPDSHWHESYQCPTTPEEAEEFLSLETVKARDLGVIVLSESVQNIDPVKLVEIPPVGFNPPQDLWNNPPIYVGRGLPGFDTMRWGTTTVRGWMPMFDDGSYHFPP